MKKIELIENLKKNLKPGERIVCYGSDANPCIEMSTTGNCGILRKDFFWDGKELPFSTNRKNKKRKGYTLRVDRDVTNYKIGHGVGEYWPPMLKTHHLIEEQENDRRGVGHITIHEKWWTDETAAAMLYMHQSGMTDRKIGEIMDRTTRSVSEKRFYMVRKGFTEFRRSLKKIDIGHGKWTDGDVSAFKVLWEKGMKLTEIAKILDRPYASCAAKRCQLFAEGIEAFAPRRARA